MGVDVDSVIFVGKHVDDPKHYLIERGVLTEEHFEDWNEDWQDHDLPTNLEIHPVSGYSDYGYYLGFQVCGDGSPYLISHQIAEYAVEFQSITGEKAGFHYWAYYH